MKEVLFFCFAACMFVFASPAMAANSGTKKTKPSLVTQVAKAQKMLLHKHNFVGCGEKRKPCTNETFAQANFALCVVDDSKRSRVIVVYSGDVVKERGFKVKQISYNGVNSQFQVVGSRGSSRYTVLALRRAIEMPDGSFKEVVYTPYSEELNVPDAHKEGYWHLMEVLYLAEKELKQKKVPSLAFRGESVTQRVPRWVAFRLAIIEHINGSVAEVKPGEAKKYVDEVLATIGLNGDDAYRYSVSKKGARGLFQITEATYNALKKQYPDAELEEDFVHGSASQVNMAKATFLLFDADLATLPKETRETLLCSSCDRAKVTSFLAVAYNAGSDNARSALRPNGTITSNIPLETKKYLEKLRRVTSELHRRNM